MTTVSVSDEVFIEPVGQVLTAEEYDALPENSRRELVDGVIRMMASPRAWHQRVKAALYNAFGRVVPEDVEVLMELEVRLTDLLRRIPDVLLVRADGFDWQQNQLLPGQVVLVVEVVRPGSETEDRLVKPPQYAQAGIEHFWRIEIDPELVVHTFRLGDDATYVPTGVFKAGDVINAPGLAWAQVPVDDLTQKR